MHFWYIMMDYVNIAQNPNCLKLFAKTPVVFSSYILDKRNRKRILVFTDDMRIFVLSGNNFTKKQDISLKHIQQITASPGRDQVIVLHVTRQGKNTKDVLCAFLDDNRANFTSEEVASRLDIFQNLLKIKLTNSDKSFNADDYFSIASKIMVSGKSKTYKLKFVCTSFPHHTDYLKFDIKGDIIKYHIPVLFGKQNRIQSANGLHVLDSNVTEDGETPPPKETFTDTTITLI